MKRANQEGTLEILKSGKYRYRATIGGTRVSGSATSNKREALNSYRAALATFLKGAPRETPTLAEYAFMLIEGPYRKDLALSTWALYEMIFRTQIKDHPIGALPLSEVSPAVCDSWLRGLKAAKRRKIGKEFVTIYEDMKPASVSRYAGFLGAIFERAIHTDNWIDKNPLKAVQKPKVSESEVKILTAQECTKLLDSLEDKRLRTAMLLMLHGLGPAEACGLKYEDFDGEGITVRRQTQMVNGKRLVLERLKTDRRRGWVPVSPELQQLLSERTSGFVLSTASGTSLLTSNLRRALNAALKHSEFRGIRPYDLRHTFGMLLLENGTDPRTAAELMRHSPEMLLKIYARSRKELKMDAIRRLNSPTSSPTKGATA